MTSKHIAYPIKFLRPEPEILHLHRTMKPIDLRRCSFEPDRTRKRSTGGKTP
jgi:hypothetical protein